MSRASGMKLGADMSEQIHLANAYIGYLQSGDEEQAQYTLV